MILAFNMIFKGCSPENNFFKVFVICVLVLHYWLKSTLGLHFIVLYDNSLAFVYFEVVCTLQFFWLIIISERLSSLACQPIFSGNLILGSFLFSF